MMRTRQNQPIVSYNEDELFSVGVLQEEEILDEQYGRSPIDCRDWPNGPLTWFKNNHTLNPHAGKVVVAGLAWIVHHFTSDSSEEELLPYDPAENEDWKKPHTLQEVKQCIACIFNEFDSGDIVGYLDEKRDEHEDEQRTDDQLYMRLSWEDIVGVCQEALQATTWTDMLPHIKTLLDEFCHAYQLQYHAM